jgi:hypothetical protein
MQKTPREPGNEALVPRVGEEICPYRTTGKRDTTHLGNKLDDPSRKGRPKFASLQLGSEGLKLRQAHQVKGGLVELVQEAI